MDFLFTPAYRLSSTSYLVKTAKKLLASSSYDIHDQIEVQRLLYTAEVDIQKLERGAEE